MVNQAIKCDQIAQDNAILELDGKSKQLFARRMLLISRQNVNMLMWFEQ
jgi:hypothetical protein